MPDRQDKDRIDPGNDNNDADIPQGLIAEMRMAVRFFSILPAGGGRHVAPQLGPIARALPFASLIIGAGPALILFGASLAGLPPLFAAGLGAAASAGVTGAMAEDGLADSADGLFGGRDTGQRLTILKDSRHGSYGVAAMVFYILLRTSALAGLVAASPGAAALMMLAASVLARSGALFLPFRLAPARTGGASAAAGRLAAGAFVSGSVLALVIGFALAAPFAGLAGYGLALVAGAGVAVVWIRLCNRLIGGQTGDTIGALQALIEVAVLAVFVIFAGE